MLLRDFEQISAWLDEAEIDVLELIGPRERLHVERDGRPAPRQPAAKQIRDRFAVKAPMAGRLLLKHPMQDTLLVSRGMRIRAGQVVALLQIGVLLVSVRTPRDGVVMDVLEHDGSLIGFGTEIVRLAGLGSETYHDD
jgi:acetyl-CoA carboxylase biotin carboxyl carrier protein